MKKDLDKISEVVNAPEDLAQQIEEGEEKKAKSQAEKRRDDQMRLYKGPNAKWALGYNRPHAGSRDN